MAELSAAEKVWTDAFRAAGNVELPFDEKLYDAYDAKIEAAEAWVATTSFRWWSRKCFSLIET